MRVQSTGRRAFILKADNGFATIAVSQPSDCMAVQEDDVVCSEINEIGVWFGSNFTSQINGPPQPEPPEVWQAALDHLLNTYQPQYCILYTEGIDTGLGEEVMVIIQTQDCYRGFWDNTKDALTLIR